MRILLIVAALIVAVIGFNSPVAGEVQYLTLDIEPGISNPALFYQIQLAVNDELWRAKEQNSWLPVSGDNPVRVVICESDSYCLHEVGTDSTLAIVLSSLPDWPISGTSGQATVRSNLPIWAEWSDAEKKIFLTGEIFRVVESRLGVYANPQEGTTYEAWQIPDWLWFGSPIAWATSIFPAEGEMLLTEVIPSSLTTEIRDLIQIETQEEYWASVYVANQLVQLSDDPAVFFYFDYLVGLSVPQEEAFVRAFGIAEIEFGAEF